MHRDPPVLEDAAESFTRANWIGREELLDLARPFKQRLGRGEPGGRLELALQLVYRGTVGAGLGFQVAEGPCRPSPG